VPEVAGNDIDDDCDGVTDELPAPDDSAEPVPVNPADTSETGETASPDTAPADEDSAGPLLEPEGLAQSKQQINCACASTRAPLAWPALALLGLLWRRRSR
jgi:MYXO-CTERM domain-containing protein